MVSSLSRQPHVRFAGGEASPRRRNSSEIGTPGRTLLRGGVLSGGGVRQHDQGITAEAGPREKIPSIQFGALSAILTGLPPHAARSPARLRYRSEERRVGKE